MKAYNCSSCGARQTPTPDKVCKYCHACDRNLWWWIQKYWRRLGQKFDQWERDLYAYNKKMTRRLERRIKLEEEKERQWYSYPPEIRDWMSIMALLILTMLLLPFLLPR